MCFKRIHLKYFHKSGLLELFLEDIQKVSLPINTLPVQAKQTFPKQKELKTVLKAAFFVVFTLQFLFYSP